MDKQVAAALEARIKGIQMPLNMTRRGYSEVRDKGETYKVVVVEQETPYIGLHQWRLEINPFPGTYNGFKTLQVFFGDHPKADFKDRKMAYDAVIKKAIEALKTIK